MSTPYYHLKNAVNHAGGVCSAAKVRRELENYLQWLEPKGRPLFNWPHNQRFSWKEIYTKEEWWESVQKKQKRPRRKKGQSDPIKHVYTTVEQEQLELREHNPDLDETHVTDLDWIDAIRDRQRAEIEGSEYHAEW